MFDRRDDEAPRREVGRQERRLQPVAGKSVAEQDQRVRTAVGIGGREARVRAHLDCLRLPDLGRLGGRQPRSQVVGRLLLALLGAIEAGIEHRDRHRPTRELGHADGKGSGLGVRDGRVDGVGTRRGGDLCRRRGELDLGRRSRDISRCHGRTRRRGRCRARAVVSRAPAGDQQGREERGRRPRRGCAPGQGATLRAGRQSCWPTCWPRTSEREDRSHADARRLPRRRPRKARPRVGDGGRDRTARLHRDLLPESRRCPRSVHLARARHLDDPLRYVDRADLLPSSELDGVDRVVHPRGQ